ARAGFEEALADFRARPRRGSADVAMQPRLHTLVDVRVGFDFDEHVGIDQLGHFDHCGRGSNVAEELSVGGAALFPIGGDIHTYMRVRTTCFSAAPAFPSADSMLRSVCIACSYALPMPTIWPFGRVGVGLCP